MMHAGKELSETVEAVARAGSFAEAAGRLIAWAQDLTGCESAMLRILEPGGEAKSWIPALIHRGHSPRFLQDEALIGAEECMCGRVCLGLGDRQLPFFTSGGSFLWGQVQSINTQFSPEALGEVRGRCLAEGYDSVVVVPMRGSGGRPVGALHLADRASHKFENWIDLLEEAGRACGPLLARYEEREVELISALETALVPQNLPVIAGLEFALAFSSASAAATVGGDFYDLQEVLPGDVLVLVGDYVGKGVEAAGVAARVRQVLAELAQSHPDPAELLGEASRLLPDILPPDRFVTLIVCRLKKNGQVVAAAAGHPQPLLLLPGSDVEEVRLTGHLPLGVGQGSQYVGSAATVPPGGALLLYTDGLSDARREGALFGVEGIAEAWRQNGSRRLGEFVQAVCEASEEFAGPGGSRDDRLAIAVRWTVPA